MKKLFEEFLEVANSRRTTKIYDKNFNIDEEIMNKIYDFGLTSPSSMGLELTRILSFDRKSKYKDNLVKTFKKANQERVQDASHFALLITKKTSFFTKNNDILRERARRVVNHSLNAQGIKYVEGMENGFFDSVINGDHANNNKNFDEWQSRQAYILLSYLLLAAKTLNIDTTTMEGFNGEEINSFLLENKLISIDEKVTLAISFGKANNKEKMSYIGDKQLRINKNEFVFFN